MYNIEKNGQNFIGYFESCKTKDHWHWRHFMAEQIADSMDMPGLGVKAIYLFGSTDTGESGMGSDIDLILYVDQTVSQRKLMEHWMDGWSRSLAKINYLYTGYNMQKMLDIHLVSDEDIKRGGSYAIRLTSAYDPITLLRKRE